MFVDNVEIVEAKDEDIVKDKPETANPKTAWSEEVTSDLSNGAEGQFFFYFMFCIVCSIPLFSSMCQCWLFGKIHFHNICEYMK